MHFEFSCVTTSTALLNNCMKKKKKKKKTGLEYVCLTQIFATQMQLLKYVPQSLGLGR